MKKAIMIAALFSFLLCLLGGYYLTLWMGERDKRMEAAQVSQTDQTLPRINEKTKMIYQYFYSKDKVTKEYTEMAPVFLQGLHLEELQSIYLDWQVVLFSPEKVILRCKIDGLSSETYILGEMDGFLAVFYEDAQKGIHLKEKTLLPLSALPEEEAEEIENGIRIEGEENLAKVLADYTS